jgi:3-deoxy-D-manno-octulosonic-acid transferase
MGLLDILGMGGAPKALGATTLVAAPADTLAQAGDFLRALEARCGPVLTACPGGSDEQLDLAHPRFAHWLKKTPPVRIVALGLDGDWKALLENAHCPCLWLNASDPRLADCQRVAVSTAQPLLPQANVTGDPLLSLPVPDGVRPGTQCERFKEQREGDRWLGYFAATGEHEEEDAYLIFNRLIRHKMGLMLLAPSDPARCEPVYREAIKYRLQTIRHPRLSTSFVPIKTRVYFIEPGAQAGSPLADFYPCADFVVAGGTLHTAAAHSPDLLTPLSAGTPVIVGPVRRDLLTMAAVRDGAVLAGDTRDDVFEACRRLLDAPALRQQQAGRGHTWLTSQQGARERVLDWLTA